MVNGRFLSRLATIWLGIAALALLGHHLIDAVGLVCNEGSSLICSADETNSQVGSEQTPDATVLHAGFTLPAITPAILGTVLTLAIVFLLLNPAAVKPPTLSPPPQ